MDTELNFTKFMQQTSWCLQFHYDSNICIWCEHRNDTMGCHFSISMMTMHLASCFCITLWHTLQWTQWWCGCHLHLTVEGWVQFHSITLEICGKQNGTKASSSLRISIVAYHCPYISIIMCLFQDKDSGESIW